MNVIRFFILNPVTVIVGVLLAALFGAASLRAIPVQLSPNIEQPIVSVNTNWPGATPYEVERAILEEQERRLKNLPGLYEMESIARDNRGRVVLTFDVGTDQDAALMRVSRKLDEVRMYPDNVERPIITAAGSEQSPIIWMVLRAHEDNPRPVETYLTYFEEYIRQHIERVPGVAELVIGGGLSTQMHIVFRPEEFARHKLPIDYVVNVLRRENVNISAGQLDIGRRGYRIRTQGEYQSIEDIRRVALVSDGERSVTVGDVAEVQFGYEQRHTPVLNNFEAAISIRVLAEAGSNVLEVTDRVAREIARLNEEMLYSEGVYLEIVNDQRGYIRGAIALLRQNIAIGGLLAAGVLLLFLRSLRPTLVVAATIPVSIVGAFGFLHLFGSTLNAMSLAGIAFSVGMLVDNAIVVLENIDRHRRMGKSALDAALQGAHEVWGAVLASSLTTIAVFLPVIFLEGDAGQLFRDIAIAVTSAVSLSLLSAISLIPSMSHLLLRVRDEGDAQSRAPEPASVIGRLGGALRDFLTAVIGAVIRRAWTRTAVILALVGAAAVSVHQLMPKAEYLPLGNRDLISCRLIPPPGLSYDERRAMGDQLFAFFEPYFEPGYEGYPGIRNVFYIGRQEYMILGVVSADQQRTRELIPLCREAFTTIPGIMGTASQASIFPGGLGAGRAITVNLGGDTIETLVESANHLFEIIQETMPGSQIRPRPSLELLYPEIDYIPEALRLRSVGMSAEQLGITLDVLMHGRRLGEFKEEGRRAIDLVLKAAGGRVDSPEALHNSLVALPGGDAVPVSSLARPVERAGLTEIRRHEQERTVYLLVTPPDEMPQQEAMELLENVVFPLAEEQGHLDGIRVRLSGAADKLTETRDALQFNFLLALMISYLLMAALLKNFLYPLVIMFTVPMAAAGGLAGFTIMNRMASTQQFDILTMLGFVILIGVVVNNAILIVYQALNHVRAGEMTHAEAVIESVRTRIRPIFMSSLTSIFGMMPLVLWPGPGSELYRGLGSVVLGGIAVSTVFTIFLTPALLMFALRWEGRK